MDLLIVEDEEIERNYLCSVISRMNLPEVQNIYGAANGLEGLSLFEKHHPAILLADIAMPLMDGLELIEIIHARSSQTLCVILSSYSNFAYAQKALRLGVEDYLLKPSDPKTIESVLKKVIKKARTRSDALKSFDALQAKEKAWKQKMISDIFICFHQEGSLVEMEKIFSMLSLEKIRIGELVLFEQMPAPKELESSSGDHVFLQHVDAGWRGVLVSEKAWSPKEKQELQNRLSLAKEVWWAKSLEELMNQKAVENQDRAKAIRKQKAQMDQIFLDLSQGNLQLAQQPFLDCLSFEELQSLCQALQEEVRARLRIEIDLLQEPATLQWGTGGYDLLEFCAREAFGHLFWKVMSTPHNARILTFSKALQYIEENYRKPISLQSTSDALNLSSFYLSRLINQQSGMSFTDLVSLYRVEKAKELIRQDRAMKEVSFQAGFRSQSYFTKVFRKITGLSPREYKMHFVH